MQNSTQSSLTDRQTPDQNLVYEGLAVRNRKAPLGLRILAYLADVGIVTSGVYIVSIVLTLVVGTIGLGFFGVVASYSEKIASEIGTIVAVVGIIILLLCVFSVYHGYFVYQEYKKGTTLGKQIFGLRVVSIDGAKLTIGQCMLRDVMRLIDCQLILPGFLSIMLSKDARRLGDMVAGTVVVYSRAKEKERNFVFVQPEAYYYYYEFLKPTAMDLSATQSFLEYAYRHYINAKPVQQAVSANAELMVKQCLSLPEGHSLSQADLELFLAEYCNQTILNAKGS